MGGTYGEDRGADWNLKKVSPHTTNLTQPPLCPTFFPSRICSQILLLCQLQLRIDQQRNVHSTEQKGVPDGL